MRSNIIKLFSVAILAMLTFAGCKKNETYPPVGDYIYIASNLVTGSGPTASTTITNSATGKVSVTPAVARVYVNTLKTADVTVTYALSGTAVAGTNYTAPTSPSITIPAGKWYADISMPVINATLSGNKTIIITLTAATNNTQVGVGTDRNYKVFTYTLTN
ncbi:MAG: hypothetical protein V4592_10120 [Bacteroidota bacterium]